MLQGLVDCLSFESWFAHSFRVNCFFAKIHLPSQNTFEFRQCYVSYRTMLRQLPNVCLICCAATLPIKLKLWGYVLRHVIQKHTKNWIQQMKHFTDFVTCNTSVGSYRFVQVTSVTSFISMLSNGEVVKTNKIVVFRMP